MELLNKATLEWRWQIASVQIITMPIKRKEGTADMPIVQVIGTLEIPGLGERQGVGTAVCEGTEDATKAAASDSLRRESSLFGVRGGR